MTRHAANDAGEIQPGDHVQSAGVGGIVQRVEVVPTAKTRRNVYVQWWQPVDMFDQCGDDT